MLRYTIQSLERKREVLRVIAAKITPSYPYPFPFPKGYP